jgi:serine/threonine-protein kinase
VSHPSVIRPRWRSSTGGTWSSFTLPPEIVQEARVRVRRVALAAIALGGTIGSAWLAAGLLGLVAWREAWTLPAGTLFTVLVSGGLIAASRSERISDLGVIRAGLAFVVFIAGIAGLGHADHELRHYGHVTAFGPYALAIALFPMLLPTSPSITVAVALVAGAAAELGLVGAARLNHVALGPATYVDAASVLAGCAVMAWVTSRAMFRLQSDVARARRLGSYELEERLGHGGMGEVWRARHHMLARQAAIKLITPRHLGDPATRRQAIERSRARRRRPRCSSRCTRCASTTSASPRSAPSITRWSSSTASISTSWCRASGRSRRRACSRSCSRSATRSPRRTRRGSCIATSSRPT